MGRSPHKLLQGTPVLCAQSCSSPATRPSPLLRTQSPGLSPDSLPELPAGMLPDGVTSLLFTDCLASERELKTMAEVMKCPVCLEQLETDPNKYELTGGGGG